MTTWVYCVRFNYRDDLLIKMDCIERPWQKICKL